MKTIELLKQMIIDIDLYRMRVKNENAAALLDIGERIDSAPEYELVVEIEKQQKDGEEYMAVLVYTGENLLQAYTELDIKWHLGYEPILRWAAMVLEGELKEVIKDEWDTFTEGAKTKRGIERRRLTFDIIEAARARKAEYMAIAKDKLEKEYGVSL